MNIPLKVLIVEDEISAVKRLMKELDTFGSTDFEVTDILDSVQGVLDWTKRGMEVDLVFMDIQLVDGISFEIFKHARINAPIIFTTAYDEYALQAFKVNSIDYLLKPINPEELERAIKDFLKRSKTYSRESYLNQLMMLASEIKPATYRSSFLVDFKQKMLLVDVRDVAYIYVKERGVFLRKKDQKEYVIEFYLDELEAQLDPALFYRANRQYLIARSSIIEVEPYFTGRLILKVQPEPPTPVLVSKEKATDFKQWADF